MRVVKALVAMLLLIGIGVAGAPVAFAHTELESSNPAKNATLASAPTEVTLTFAEPVRVPNGAITITGPNGASWSVGTPRTAGASVVAPVQASGPAGAYTLTWKVKSDDGDTLTGTIPFSLSAPAGAAAAPTAQAAPAPSSSPVPVVQAAPAPTAGTTDTSGGVPAWAWVVGAVVVVAVAVGGVSLVRRRS